MLLKMFLGSRTPGKGTYASWLRYLKTRKGKNISYEVEPMLS